MNRLSKIYFIFILWTQLNSAESCGSDGRYCSAILNANVLMGTSLEYKCLFPIFLAKSDILKLDPATFITMKTSQYCPSSCCQTVAPTTAKTSTTVTVPSTPVSSPSTKTTTTTTVRPTTAKKDLLQQFNDAMNKNAGFKGLLNKIHFNSSALDGLLRFEKYAAERKSVNEHNIDYSLGLSTYKMATNRFSVAFDNEIAPLSLSLDNLKPERFDEAIGKITNNRKKRDSTNDTVDWRPIMKPILNQLTCGGCWAFSMISMLEGFFVIKNIETTSLSVQQLINCDTAKDPALGLANTGCSGGYFQVASTYLKVRGERNSEDIPFDMEDKSCDTGLFAPVVPTLLTFDQGYISATTNETKLIAMEQNIEDKVRKGPVAVGMALSQDIYNYDSGVYDGDCGTSINHAVVIVGFTPDYWIIRNSWGPDWGEKGYIRIKRTAGKDPCRLYQYWSQAISIGANETFLPPKTGGNGYIALPTTSNGSTLAATTVASIVISSGNLTEEQPCGEICEAVCDCYDDDDDDDDDYTYYESDDNDDDEIAKETSSTSSSSSSTTTFPSTTTSTSTSTRTTTTTKTTTTPKPSLFEIWWKNIANWG